MTGIFIKRLEGSVHVKTKKRKWPLISQGERMSAKFNPVDMLVLDF